MKLFNCFVSLILAVSFSVNAAQQTINVGTTANDNTGDTLRAAMQKTNANFTELYSDKQAADADLTAIAAITAANDDFIQRKAGAWINRTMAQLKSDLALVKADVGLGNVDNTSNATERAAVRTLTNATISGASNTITNVAASSVLPPGSTTEIPFNDGGAWSTDTVLTWDKVNNALNVGDPNTASNDGGRIYISGTGAGAGSLGHVGFAVYNSANNVDADASMDFQTDFGSLTMFNAPSTNTNSLLTGGPSGARAVIASYGAIPLSLGSNGIERVRFPSAGGMTVNETSTFPAVTISGAAPGLTYVESDNGTDLKNWRAIVDNGVYVIQTRTDANGSGKNGLTISRGVTTAISNVAIGNATDNNTVTFNGTGTITVGGAVSSTNTLTGLRFIPTSATASGNSFYLPAANSPGIAANGAGQVWIDTKTGVRKSSITISASERAAVGGVTYTNTTQTGNSAATETDAFSHTLTAATLGADGESLEFEAAGTFAATASVDKRVKVVFGSTVLFDTGALAVTSAADWSLRGTIVRTGAATQKANVQFSSSFTSFNSSSDYTAATETLSNALTLKLTVNGTNANDTLAQFYKEKWFPFM